MPPLNKPNRDTPSLTSDALAYAENAAKPVPHKHSIGSFFHVPTVELVLQDHQFGASEWLREQILLARDPDPKIKQRALAEIRKYMAELNEQDKTTLKETREGKDSAGRNVTQTVTRTTTERLLAGMKDANDGSQAYSDISNQVTRTSEPTESDSSPQEEDA